GRPPASPVNWTWNAAYSARSPHPVGLEDGIDRLLGRRWDRVFAPERNHLAGEPVQLEPVACFKIVRHRGLHGGGKTPHGVLQLCRKVLREDDARRLPYGQGLMHQLEQEGSHILVIPDDTERLARACGNARSAGEQDKFLPEVEKHVVG